MTKTYTTIEQSKHLLELGLDSKTADMSYRWCTCKLIDGEPREDWLLEVCAPFDECPDEQIPCWSLGALIETLKPIGGNTYTITGTLDGSAFVQFEGATTVAFQEKTTFESVYNMVCWLLENNFINKENQ